MSFSFCYIFFLPSTLTTSFSSSNLLIYSKFKMYDWIPFLSITIFYPSSPVPLSVNRWFALPILISTWTIIVIIVHFHPLIFIFLRFSHFRKPFSILPAILNAIIPFIFMQRLYPPSQLGPHLIWFKCSPPFPCV